MKYLLLSLLLATFSAGSWGYWQKSRADDAIERAAVAEAAVAHHQHANNVLNDYLEKVEQENEVWRTKIEELEQEDGFEDILSPYLRGVLNSVR